MLILCLNYEVALCFHDTNLGIKYLHLKNHALYLKCPITGAA